MGDDETTNEEAFAHDLMAAGYQKPNSEAENKFLRKYDLSRDDTLSDDNKIEYIRTILLVKHILYTPVQKIGVM